MDEVEGAVEDDELLAEADDEAEMEEMLEEISFAEFAASIPQLEAAEAQQQATEQIQEQQEEQEDEDEQLDEELSNEEVLLENPPLTAEEEAEEAHTDDWLTHVSTLQDGLDTVEGDGEEEQEEDEEEEEQSEEDEEEEGEEESEEEEEFQESSFLEADENVHEDSVEMPHEDLLLEVSEHTLAEEQKERELEQQADNSLPTQAEEADAAAPSPAVSVSTVSSADEEITFESDVDGLQVEADVATEQPTAAAAPAL